MSGWWQVASPVSVGLIVLSAHSGVRANGAIRHKRSQPASGMSRLSRKPSKVGKRVGTQKLSRGAAAEVYQRARTLAIKVSGAGRSNGWYSVEDARPKMISGRLKDGAVESWGDPSVQRLSRKPSMELVYEGNVVLPNGKMSEVYTVKAPSRYLRSATYSIPQQYLAVYVRVHESGTGSSWHKL